ncbi:MAG: serine/threonine protein kinase [Planctomycetes bacterium]|nr:serine/threonine protein kinase [Planctomycetota bacterium]
MAKNRNPASHWQTRLQLLLLVCGSSFGASLSGEEWPEFRGPTGQGHTEVQNLPVQWDADTNIRWRRPIEGLGWSSPVCVDGHVYLTAAVPQPGADPPEVSLRVIALRVDDGSMVWTKEVLRQPADAPRIHQKNSHASPTVVVNARRLYAHFGHQGTVCLDLQGNTIWKNTELGYRPVHGNGGTPALFDGGLYFSCDGGEDPFLVALTAADGRLRWRSPRVCDGVKKFAFSTPLVITVAGQPLLISPGAQSVGAFDPKTGAEIWRVRYDGYSVIPRPVYGHGLVFISTGYDSPQVLAIRPDGAGDVTDTHVAWSFKKGAPHTPSLLLHDRELYMVSDNGIASCLDAISGDLIWQQRLGGNFSASPLYGDGKLYFQSESGVGSVLRAGRKFELLSSNDLGERTLASYAVAGRGFLIRSAENLYRVEERGQ